MSKNKALRRRILGSLACGIYATSLMVSGVAAEHIDEVHKGFIHINAPETVTEGIRANLKERELVSNEDDDENNGAVGGNAVAVGFGATALGNNATALGSSTLAKGTESISIGSTTLAIGDRSITLGSQTAADGMGSIAIGNFVQANKSNSVSIGTKTKALAENTIAIGTEASANEMGSMALGYDAASFQYNTIAIGLGSKSKLSGSIALGANASTGSENTQKFIDKKRNIYGNTAIGASAHAQDGMTVALGVHAIANETYATALGAESRVVRSGRSALAIGAWSYVGAEEEMKNQLTFNGNDTLFKKDLSKDTEDIKSELNNKKDLASLTTGENAYYKPLDKSEYIEKERPNEEIERLYGEGKIDEAKALEEKYEKENEEAKRKRQYGSMAIGLRSVVTGNKSIAIGVKAGTRNNFAGAIGNNARSIADAAYAIGSWSIVEGKASTAVGTLSHTKGEGAVALGAYANALGDNAATLGSMSEAKGKDSVALGFGANVEVGNSVALGAYSNVTDNAKPKDGKAFLSNEEIKADNGVISIGSTKNDFKNEINNTTINKENLYRRIVNVAGGVEDNDAVNVKQLKAIVAATGLTPEEITNIANADENKPKNLVERIDEVKNSAITDISGDINISATKDESNGNKYNLHLNKRVILNDGMIDINSEVGKGYITVGFNRSDMHQVKIDGKEGTVTGLTNKTWAPDKIVSGRAATEDQLAALENKLSTVVNPVVDSKETTVYAADDSVEVENTVQEGEAKNYSVKVSTKLQEVINKNTAGVDANAENIAKNGDMIAKNGEAINANTKAINDNKEAIDANTNVINANKADIAKNADAINNNKGAIDTNAKNIGTNAENIAKNGDMIAKNGEAIGANTDAIKANKGAIDTNTNAINANKADIAKNIEAIGKNTKAINDNKDAISANSDKIAENAGKISANEGRLTELEKGWKFGAKNSEGELVGDVSDVQAGNQVNVIAGSNINLEKKGNDLTIGLKGEIAVSKVTLGDVNISTEGINAGGKKVSNVANGAIGADSKDAINGSQLHSVKEALENGINNNAKAINDNKGAIDTNTNAISANTKAINDNKDAIGANTNAINANKADIAKNTDAISANAKAINDNKDAIDANTNAISGNKADIAKNTDAINANKDAINTNTKAINANKADIAKNTNAINNNAGKIATNAENIGKNADDISANKADIAKNTNAISVNAKAINDNKGAIGANADAINANKAAIGENAKAINANKAAIAKNAGAINKNTQAISANKDAIDANTNAISTNKADIAKNTDEISANAKAINTNKDVISANTNAINENKGAIGENAKAINANTDAISKNIQAIADNAGKIATNAENIGKNANGINANKADIVDLKRGWTLGVSANGGTAAGVDSAITAGTKVDLQAGKNISISKVDNTINMALSDNIEVKSVAAESGTIGKVSMDNNGINAGGTKITGVEAGTIGANSTDAINGGQLHKVQTELNNKLAANESSIQENGKAIADNKAVINNLEQGWNLGVKQGEGTAIGTATAVKAGEKAELQAGKNIVLTQNGKTVDVALNENIKVNDVTANTATIGNVKFVTKEEVIDADGNTAKITTITGVADGDISANSTDAVNGSQLHDAMQVVSEIEEVAYKNKAFINQLQKDGKVLKDYLDGEHRGIMDRIANDHDAIEGKMKNALLEHPVAYTDAEGNKIIKDGQKWLDKDGNDITSKVDTKTLSHTLVSPDGTFDTPSRLGNVAAGTHATDAVNYGQLQKVENRVDRVENAVSEVKDQVASSGALGAALSALKPLAYDPNEKTQIMAGLGYYSGRTAIGIGLAHHDNEDTLVHGGLSYDGAKKYMFNAGVTWRIGGRKEQKDIPAIYQKRGPITAVAEMCKIMEEIRAENAALVEENKKITKEYATLQKDNAELHRENEVMKGKIAKLMAHLGLVD